MNFLRIGNYGFAVAFCCAAIVLAGCGDSRPSRVTVSGKVLIDGKPLTGGTLAVIPAKARAASADIGPDGRFTLSSFGDNDGVVKGTHVVTVICFEDVDSETRKWLVPKKYSDPETSDKTVTIDGPTDSLMIELNWDGEKPLIEKINKLKPGE